MIIQWTLLLVATLTPEGKVISAAFMDSYNNMVKSLKNYKSQRVTGGLGREVRWASIRRPTISSQQARQIWLLFFPEETSHRRDV